MRLLSTALLALLAVGPAAAADRDADGLPDDLELALGTDPAFAERLELICQDKSRDDGDRGVSRDNYSAERDVTELWFAPAGRGRYVWRIDFAARHPAANSQIILYLNADDDRATGRKDTPDGWDYMLIVTEGRAIARHIDAAGNYDDYRPPLIAIRDNHLFISADLELHQAGGRSVYDANVLSETLQPRKGVDWTGAFQVSAAGESSRPKVMTAMDLTESQGIRVSGGLDLIRRVARDPANVVIPIESCQFHGFAHDLRVEYREDSARRTAGKGTITARVPRAGRWHPAVIFYDGGGDERLLFKVNGQQRGVLVANVDDNRQRLFALAEAIALKEGDTITLETVTSQGTYRTEDLLLLKQLPPAWQRAFDIHWVGVRRPWDSDGTTAVITWTTSPYRSSENWCTKSWVEYGLTDQYGQRTEASRALCNHRATLSGLEPDAEYHFRVVAEKPDGTLLRTRDATFVAAAPELPEGAAQRERLPLAVVSPGPHPAGTWPLTFGVPLPRGTLGRVGNVRLLNAQGTEVPLQATVTARWDDGTIKWLLLDFAAELPAAPEPDPQEPPPLAGYFLEYGSEVRPTPSQSPLSVQQADDAITVTTGPTRFEISRTSFAPFSRVWRDANGDADFTDAELVSQANPQSGLRLEDAEGTLYTSLGPPSELAVEQSGPLRATLKVAGPLTAEGETQLFNYEARLHFYAGQPFVRMDLAFANDNVEQTFTNIRSLSLRVPVREAGPASCPAVPEPQQGPLSMSHLLESLYEVRRGEAAERHDGRQDGWIAARTPTGSVGAAVRNFWQLYPKGLAADGAGIEIGLLPPLDKGLYQSDGEDDYKLYYYLREGTYKLKVGVSKRHELLLAFGPQDLDMAAAASHAQHPLLAAADPQWYCDTKVFGNMAAPSQRAFPDYEPKVSAAMDDYLRRRERVREYGMMNFGDWWGERGINWGNIEYDTQHAFLLQWARSGDLRFFTCGEQAARHHMDVDTIRHHADPGRIGGVYTHCIGHVGDYYARPPVEGKGITRGGLSVSHTWTEGLLDYYFLTGDRRSLETARLIADRYDSLYTRNYDFSNCRVPGWHLILTTAVYDATGDPYYLNAARLIIERVLERQTPDGGWRRQLVPGHCLCTPQHHGNAGFMVAVLLTGMKRYHQITGDQRIPESMRRAARFLIEDMWVPEVKGFRYTSCPQSSAGVWSNFMIFDGAMYAANLTGDEVIAEHARIGLRAAIEAGVSGFGKSFSQQTCV
ncbi:MAG: hypothetical protein ACE5R4_17440, partial [Armatimonadota bacterium]